MQNVKRIHTLGLFVIVVSAMSGCMKLGAAPVVEVKRTPAGVASSSPTVAPTADPAGTLSITAMSAPVGWKDSAGKDLKISFSDTSTNSNLSFECRAGYQSEVASLAWQACTKAAGYVVPASANLNANGIQLNNGTYKAEVRVKLNGSVLRTSSTTFYVHPSLNNVADCSASNSDADYFTEAAKYLAVGSHFGGSTHLSSGPFQTIQWASGNTSSFATLRKQLALNADNSLIIIRRSHVGFAGQSCNVSVGIRKKQTRAISALMGSLGVPFSGSNHSMYCQALVINADGDAACFQNGLGRPAFVAKASQGFNSNVHGSYRLGNMKHAMFRMKVSGSDASAVAARASILSNDKYYQGDEDEILVLNP